MTPHSIAWYEQLGKLTGQYSFPWNSTIPEPNTEAIFDDEVLRMVENKKVLDIGCGHGDFAIRCSPRVKEIVGLDITSDFIKTCKDNNFNNVTFIVSDTQNRLPFNDEQFDYVYNRKGPTSAYIDLKRIVKNGGHIISLHPGDQISPEISQFFPNLFESPLEGTSRLDKIKRNLKKGMLLEQTTIETVTSVSYLKAPSMLLKSAASDKFLPYMKWLLVKTCVRLSRFFIIMQQKKDWL